MKRLITLLMALFLSYAVFAQDKLLTFNVGYGLSSMSTKINEYKGFDPGTCGNIGLYYNHSPKWSFGAEMSYSFAFVGNYVDTNNGGSGLTFISYFSHYLLKTRYFLGRKKVKTHVGLGVGYFDMRPAVVRVEDNFYNHHPISAIGFVPEFGLHIYFFELTVLYSMAPNTVIGEDFNMSYSNFQIRANFNINFIKKKK
ncbi:porin family protein [Flammeovirga agarivorans]|uniref:Porin family protein n=1 Tax=Flammeovirga agarivorans TaxID=2726742 RepID=A0A7X8SP45_9BACT|nr:porin family protein [Flammeovirga agarivorans]NLR93809.1 porin family protein [Flammeovirga agarivorans]